MSSFVFIKSAEFFRCCRKILTFCPQQQCCKTSQNSRIKDKNMLQHLPWKPSLTAQNSKQNNCTLNAKCLVIMVLIVILVALNSSNDFSIIIRQISTTNQDEFQVNGILINKVYETFYFYRWIWTRIETDFADFGWLQICRIVLSSSTSGCITNPK